MPTVQQLLDNTSRTFALAIPLLPEPTRTDVSLAYLVFRIVDTLEDADNLTATEKREALAEVDKLLARPNARRATAFARRWAGRNPTDHHWYRQLLEDTPLVLETLSSREPAIQRIILENAGRTTRGMASFIGRRGTQLHSTEELQRYCYFVAGIVGEMLSEIFAERVESLSLTDDLRNDARAFGEGLQLVNIVRDADIDARAGRLFLPDDIDRQTIFQLAHDDLTAAARYVDRLRQASAPDGYVAFTELPLRLGRATLDSVERCGPGAKVPRDELARILAGVAAEGSPEKSPMSGHTLVAEAALRKGAFQR